MMVELSKESLVMTSDDDNRELPKTPFLIKPHSSQPIAAPSTTRNKRIMAVNLTGTWNFDASASTDPDALLTLEGFNWVMRKAARNLTSISLKIKQNGNDYDFKMETPIKSFHIKGAIGSPTFEQEVDGKMTKVTLSYEDSGKTVMEQHKYKNSEGKQATRTHRRSLEDGGRTLVQLTSLEVEGETASCRRVFRIAA